MKIALPIISLLVILGIVYGLAFVGALPVKKLAQHSKPAARILTALKLYRVPRAAPSKPGKKLLPIPPDPLAADKMALAAEKQQLDVEKAALDKRLAAPVPPPAPAAAPAAASAFTTSGKMSAIYDTMKPAEIAAIFTKLPDTQVCDALIKMDEQKAGKVLVALPAARAARLTMMMNQATATGPQTPQPAQSSPATSVP